MISKARIKWIKSLEMRKYRLQHQAFVAEGPKLVGELLPYSTPLYVAATKEWLTENKHLLGAVGDVDEVSREELERASLLRTPQTVLAVMPIPHPAFQPSALNPQLVLALDGVQDPGNLGTIIRIADWFGIDTIVCSPDTADAWSPKVVQATMGSIARVRIVYTDLQEYLSKATVPICGTLLDGENIYAQKLPQEAIIVMGNEGNGISPAIRQLVTHRLLIPPFRPGAESLNVAIATAITCSEFRRRTE